MDEKHDDSVEVGAQVRDNQVVDVYVETERLVLRQFTEDDVDMLVELDSDPEVMHFITGGRPTPREGDRAGDTSAVAPVLRGDAGDRILGC